MVGYERGSTARTAGSDASLRAGRLVAGRRIRRRPVPTACVRGAGLHARWPWLLFRVRTTGAPARCAGVPPAGFRRSIRLAGPECERMVLSRRPCSSPPSVAPRPLVAARSPRRVAAATEAPVRTRAAKGGSAVPSRVLAYALPSVEWPPPRRSPAARCGSPLFKGRHVDREIDGTLRMDVPVSGGGQRREDRRFSSEQEARRDATKAFLLKAMKGQRSPRKQ